MMYCKTSRRVGRGENSTKSGYMKRKNVTSSRKGDVMSMQPMTRGAEKGNQIRMFWKARRVPLPFAHNKPSEKMPRKDENTPPSSCNQPHLHRMPRNHGKLTVHSDFVQHDPNASPPRLSKIFVFGDNQADPPSPCPSLTPLRRLQQRQQMTPTPHTSGRALRDITQSHLQSHEYQTKPVTVSVLSSSSDNENDLTNDTTLKTTKLVSRKRPRDPSDVSPISKKEASIEEAIHYVPRRPRRPALSPFSAIVARETSSRKINVSTRSFLRDFISTERNVYNITAPGDFPVPPFGCVYSNDANDGKFLAVADEDGTISILNTKLDNSIEWEKPRDTFHAHDNAIFDFKWRDDDQAMLTASGDQTARLWDVERRECTAVFSGHRCSVKSASFNPLDPNMIVTGSRDGSIMLWDVRCTGVEMETGATRYKPIDTIRDAHLLSYSTPNRKKRRIETALLSQGEKSVTAVLFMPHQDHLIASAGAADGLIKYWDIRQTNNSKSNPTPVSLSVYDGPAQRPRGLSSLTLDNTGSRLFTVSLDNQIYMYDAHHLGKPMSRYHHNSSFHCTSFYVKTAVSPDGRFVASGSADHSLAVWEVDRPDRPPVFFKGHSNEVTSVGWCKKDPFQLATCSDDATVRVWNVNAALAEKYRDTENWDEMVGIVIEGDVEA